MCLQHKKFSIWLYNSFHYTVVEKNTKESHKALIPINLESDYFFFQYYELVYFSCFTVGENHTQLCIQMSLHHFHIIMRKMTIDVEKKHLELHSPDSTMTDHEPIFC